MEKFVHHTTNAANDEVFNVRVFFFPKGVQDFLNMHKEFLFLIRTLESALLEDNGNKVQVICQSLLEKLINVFGDKKKIPPVVLDSIFPINNWNIPIHGRMDMCLVLFSVFPNNKNYQKFKETAEEGIQIGLSIAEIQQQIQDTVSNNLFRWEITQWNQQSNPFGRKRKV